MKKLMLSVRRLHRYLMALISIQVVIWMLSGLYMVLFDIDYIRGNHLAKPTSIDSLLIEDAIALTDLYKQYEITSDVILLPYADGIAYSFKSTDTHYLINAVTGLSLLPIGKEQAVQLAKLRYNKTEIGVSSVTFIDNNAPSELAPRHLPVWRIEFDNGFSDTLYLNANTGQVVTKRHVWWRVFDIFWMLHIMDYETRSDVSNWLLRIFSGTFILAIFTGLFLLVGRFSVTRRIFFKRDLIAR